MRKLREGLRLRFALKLSQRQIARSCSIGQTTVYDYLKRAQAAGVLWPLPEDWDETRLEETLFGPPPRRLYESHRNLTLQLLWEEYRQNHTDGYRVPRPVAMS
ncbi:MAG: hypothetical protein DMG38_07325 [Acidobacteria bacterium]|nr:MAG: hypothetical protein DMG38_07325 [Acidobacteriota bacterium]